MMPRRPELLDGTFDLLVVGGGIYGAWTAWDASLRGLRVALVERDDWAAHTSSASSKLLHGGLRYLEHGDVGLVRKSLSERERLLRLAPHRAWPLRFHIPVWRHSRRPAWQLRAGLLAYDLLAGGLPPDRRWRWQDAALPAAGILAPGAVACPSYGDAGTDDARLVIELVAGALAAGAVAVNRAEVVRLERSVAGAVVGAVVRADGAERLVRAGATVVCAGPWAAELAGLPATAIRRTRGVHLTMPPLPLGGATPGLSEAVTDTAVLLTHPADGRVFFLIPWYGATLVGTTDTDDATPEVTARDIAYLLAGVRAACPGLGWTEADIRASWAGVRTLLAATGAASAASREWQMQEPAPGLLVSLGGKLTSARVEADHLVTAACRILGRDPGRCPTADRPLPWAPAQSWPEFFAAGIARGVALGLDAACAATAVRRHGTQVDRLFAAVRADPALATRVLAEAPLCRAELELAREEMASTDDDVWRRRTPLAILGPVTEAASGSSGGRQAP